MRISRFHLPQALTAGMVVEMPVAAAHHALTVLRLREGQALQVFDGEGAEHRAAIERIEGRRVRVRIGEALSVNRESPLRVRLAQGICSHDKMDFTLQKAVELGVAAIQPIRTQRSVVKLDEQRAVKRLEHWQAVVAGACEQSGRAVVPQVLPPLTLAQWLARPESGSALRLLLSPAASDRLVDLPPPQGGVDMLIGPEGGLAEEEQQMALAAGFGSVRLGPRVLRTETAGLAALAVMQSLWGDF